MLHNIPSLQEAMGDLRTHPLSILLIDSNRIQLDTIRSFLEAQGWPVRTCDTLAKALKLLPQHHIDLIIGDVLSPDGTSVAPLRQIQALNPTIRTIIYSTHSSKAILKQALNQGAFAFVEQSEGPEALMLQVLRAQKHPTQPECEHPRRTTVPQVAPQGLALQTRHLSQSEPPQPKPGLDGQDSQDPQRDRLIKLMLNTGPGCIKRVAMDGTLLSINSAGLKMIEAEDETDVIGMLVSDLVVPEHRPDFERLHQRVLRGEPQTLQFQIQGLKGTFRWMETYATPFHNPLNDQVEHLAVTHDITDRKRAEQRLEKINGCFLGFGNDPIENIKSLTTLAGELLNGTAALYSRLEGELLCSIAQWQTPQNFNSVDKAEGHLCYDLIQRGEDRTFVVRHLSQTPWAQSDPNVRQFHLQTYVGQAVKRSNISLGSLCVVFQRDLIPSQEDERVLGILSSAIGVEEERLLGKEYLLQSEERFRSLYDDVPSMYFTIAKDGKILAVNRFGAEQLGYHPSELIGQPMGLIIHEKDRDMVTDRLARVFGQTNPLDTLEFRKKKKSGEPLWVRESIRILSSKAAPSGIQDPIALISCQDISVQKMAQESVKNLESQLHDAIQASNTGLWNWNVETAEVFYSSEWKRQLGYEDHEISGNFSEWASRLHPDDHDQAVDYARRYSLNPIGSYSQEFRMKHKDGTYRWIAARGSFSSSEHHKLLQGSHTDITPLKMIESTLREREAFQSILRTISAHFITASPQEIDDGIIQALQTIGEFYGVDRSYLFEFSEAGHFAANTHEWCVDPSASQLALLQEVPVELFAWSDHQIKQGTPVLIPDVSNLPQEAASDKEQFAQQQIKSLAIVPIRTSGLITGFIGFDSIRSRRDWSTDTVTLLEMTGDIIVQALEHKRAEMLLNLQHDILEQGVKGLPLPDSLTALCQHLESLIPGSISSILGMELETNRLTFLAGPRIPPLLQEKLTGLFPGIGLGSCAAAAFTGERVLVQNTQTDSRWDKCRDVAKEFNIEACWSWPILAEGNRVLGTLALSFSSPRSLYPFHLRTINTATALCEILLQRGQRESEKKRAEEALREMNVALANAMPGISKISHRGRYIEVNDHYANMLGFLPDELIGQTWERTVNPVDLSSAKAAYDRMIQTGTEEFEAQAVRKNGSTFYKQVLLVKANPQNQPQYSHHCFMRDITVRKENETVLQLSESSIRELYEITSDEKASFDSKIRSLLNLGRKRFGLANGILTKLGENQLELQYLLTPDSSIIEGTVIPYCQSFCAIAIESSQPLMIEHVGMSPWKSHVGYQTLKFEAYLGTKVMIRDHIYGTLCFTNNTPHPRLFSTHDSNFLSLMARWIGNEIERQQADAAIQEANEKHQALSRRLLTIQETEKRHLARDLHDELGQALTAVKINLQSLQQNHHLPSPHGALSDSLDLLDNVLGHIRELSLDLRPSLLDDLGLVATIRWFVKRQAQRAEWQADLHLDQHALALSSEQSTTCFRVIQEALTNVMRHAQATQVEVGLASNKGIVEIWIKDNGSGFQIPSRQDRALNGHHFGILSMQERMELLHGTLSIVSQPQQGTEVRGQFPLNPA